MAKGRRRNTPEQDALVGRGASGKYGADPGSRKKKAAAAPPESENAPESFFSGDPSPLAGMTAAGAAIWRAEIGPTLKQVMLQPQGYPIFAMYCEELARVARLRKAIEDKGGEVMRTPSGYDRKRPEVELLAGAKALVVKLAEQLNLTPKSWINSTGTRADRQLDMFAAKGAPNAPAQPSTASPSAPTGGAKDNFDKFIAKRPAVH